MNYNIALVDTEFFPDKKTEFKFSHCDKFIAN